jgi:cobalt/nickel transport system permease protein
MLLRRLAAIIPFLALMSILVPFSQAGESLFSLPWLHLSCTTQGLDRFLAILLKAIFALTVMLLLTSTTALSDILAGLERLGVPSIFTSVAFFLARYSVIIQAEAHRMLRAKRARTIRPNAGRDFLALSWIIGVLFLRTFERGERIYRAMQARGYQGRMPRQREWRLDQPNIFALGGGLGWLLAIKTLVMLL